MKKNIAVFLDRDGTINEEVGYLDCLDKLRLIDGAAEAVKTLNDNALKAVVVTNQAGVAKGLFPEEIVNAVHSLMQQILMQEGAYIDAYYYCPHHPTEGKGVYLQTCSCRKPRPGMLLKASEELNIELECSYMIGDRIKDIEAATAVGAKGILVKTGYGLNSIEEKQSMPHIQPSYIADDIMDAVTWILKDRMR